MMRLAMAVVVASALAGSVVAADGVTEIQMTDKVVLPNAVRLGINIGGDNYWDSSILKVRSAENFEGVIYRMVTWGPEQDANGVAVWFSPAKGAWEAMKGKVKYTILGGPAKGQTGNIRDFTTRKIKDGRELTYIVFDHPVPPSTGNKNGVLLEYVDPTQGASRDSNNTAFWNTEGNTAVSGDVPPGSFGQNALLLKGSEKPAHYATVPMWPSQGGQNGSWHVEFWAKARTPGATLKLDPDVQAAVDVPLTSQWKKHTFDLKITGASEQKRVTFRLRASGGDVLVDDYVIQKEEKSENPTAFRDPFVNLLKGMKPGTVRMLQMGGSDLEQNFRPRLKQIGHTREWANLTKSGRNSVENYEFNIHDFYVLCEYLGTDPWYCLPGTIYPEEMQKLMEYLAAPAGVGYGKVRAELGHPEPWTKTFKNIYVEFGNEAWNPAGYATGSYNGPDHWKDLTEAGKASPHYAKNIRFVAGSQSGSVGVTTGVLRDAPNMDMVAIAPYVLNGTKASQIEHLKTDEDIYRWVFGYTIRRAIAPEGSVSKHFALTEAAKKELCIYEHNFHLTNPRPNEKDAVPLEWRNRVQTSLGGGLNIVNDALLMMRERQIRTQCQFNLTQASFTGGIKLWGFVPGLNVQDQRYRPHYLAAQIVNETLAGDMVQTVHGGEDPRFATTGVFEDTRDRQQTYDNVPAIWSYAFSGAEGRGVVIFNLDTATPRTVKLNFAGAAKGAQATATWLTAPSIGANNEPGHPVEVTTRREEIANFVSGATLTLPPHSMVGVRWK